MRQFFIMSGLPGTMKSSTATMISRSQSTMRDGAVIVSGDSIRTMLHNEYHYDRFEEKLVYDLVMQCFLVIAKTGRNIIYDEVNLTVRDRREIIRLAHDIGYKPTIVYCASDGKHLERRMADPKGYDPERWRRVITEMEAQFQVPTPAEGCNVINRDEDLPKRKEVPRFGKDFI